MAWKVAPPGALGAWEPQVKTATVADGDSSWLRAVCGGESLELGLAPRGRGEDGVLCLGVMEAGPCREGLSRTTCPACLPASQCCLYQPSRAWPLDTSPHSKGCPSSPVIHVPVLGTSQALDSRMRMVAPTWSWRGRRRAWKEIKYLPVRLEPWTCHSSQCTRMAAPSPSTTKGLTAGGRGPGGSCAPQSLQLSGPWAVQAGPRGAQDTMCSSGTHGAGIPRAAPRAVQGRLGQGSEGDGEWLEHQWVPVPAVWHCW